MYIRLDREFKMRKGESWLRIGNANSRPKFSLGPAEFLCKWPWEEPAHHCALGVAHARSLTVKFTELAGVLVLETR